MAATGVLLAHRSVKGQTTIGAPLSWYGRRSLQVASAHIMIYVGGGTSYLEVGFDPFDLSHWFHDSFEGLVVLLPAFHAPFVIPSMATSSYFSCNIRDFCVVVESPLALLLPSTDCRRHSLLSWSLLSSSSSLSSSSLSPLLSSLLVLALLPSALAASST
jgi:hypothetical protein